MIERVIEDHRVKIGRCPANIQGQDIAQAFLITVAIAASTAFATPIASPVNTLVLNPGGYRFVDFLKVGLPMQLLILVATLLAVPLLF